MLSDLGAQSNKSFQSATARSSIKSSHISLDRCFFGKDEVKTIEFPLGIPVSSKSLLKLLLSVNS